MKIPSGRQRQRGNRDRRTVNQKPLKARLVHMGKQGLLTLWVSWLLGVCVATDIIGTAPRNLTASRHVPLRCYLQQALPSQSQLEVVMREGACDMVRFGLTCGRLLLLGLLGLRAVWGLWLRNFEHTESLPINGCTNSFSVSVNFGINGFPCNMRNMLIVCKEDGEWLRPLIFLFFPFPFPLPLMVS